jgi:hypothetical protein
MTSDSDFTDGNLTPEETKIMKSLYTSLEPYQYFLRYLSLARMVGRMDFKPMVSFYQIGSTSMAIKEGKILNIDADLIPLIEDTKPDFSDLRFKYPAIFVNQKITIGKFLVNGYLIVDLDEVERFYPNIQRESDSDYYMDGKRVLAVILNEEDNYEFFVIHGISTSPLDFTDEEDVSHRKDMQEMGMKIRGMACNLLNILANDEKDISYVQIPARNNEKRIKRGKPLQRDVLFIRLGGETKRYAQYYKKHRSHSNIRFFVGGYRKHLRSDFFKEKKGQTIWVKPYYKNMDAEFECIPRFAEVRGGKE